MIWLFDDDFLDNFLFVWNEDESNQEQPALGTGTYFIMLFSLKIQKLSWSFYEKNENGKKNKMDNFLPM